MLARILQRAATAAKQAPLYPVVFALFPILHAAIANYGDFSTRSLALALLATGLATAACIALVRPLLGRSWHRAALVVLIIALLFWSYGFLVEQAARLSAVFLASYSQTLVDASFSAACLLLLVLCGWRIRRVAPGKIERLTTSLNGAAAVLLVVLGVQTIAAAHGSASETRRWAQSPRAARAATGLPDIYYVILDGYARSDVLRQYYGMDNQLAAALRERGFLVAEESTSNYFWTELSLSSSLNMDYIQNLMTVLPEKRRLARLHRLIRDNSVVRFLREHGYRYVRFRPGWGPTDPDTLADKDFACARGLADDEFLRTLADTSWLRVLRSRMGMELAQCYQHQFVTLTRLGSSPGPKFVFAHFLLPHHPYLFDRDGTVLRHVPFSNRVEAQQEQWEDRAAYVNQLLYVDRQVIAAIDGILRGSRRKPIIVVQSDHGPNLREGLSFAEHQRVRFANLAAFHLPDAPADLLPADVTPVNEFRYIFNHYFDARLAILPNQRFYSDYSTPGVFESAASETGTAHE